MAAWRDGDDPKSVGPAEADCLPTFAALVRAPNPGPLTLEGTNTYVLHGDGGVIVVDPGPDDAAHLARVAAFGRISLIVLTHWHLDHAAGADALRARTGAPVWAHDPALRRGEWADAIDVVSQDADGDQDLLRLPVLEAAGIPASLVPLPGHTGDSIGVFLAHADQPCLLTGDTLLGRGPSVVAPPDGNLGAYLRSLIYISGLSAPPSMREAPERRPAGLRRGKEPVRLLPGHGPVRTDAAEVAREVLAHRARRLDEVRRALAAGAIGAAAIVREVYAEVDPLLWPAAERSVQAQLDYLAEQGPGPRGR